MHLQSSGHVGLGNHSIANDRRADSADGVLRAAYQLMPLDRHFEAYVGRHRLSCVRRAQSRRLERCICCVVHVDGSDHTSLTM